MPAPQFVLDLRRHIGTAPLWLSGVTAFVLDAGAERVLLVRRADNGDWTPVTGIIDPGEEPAATAVREVREETGVESRMVRLVDVRTLPEITHANGDRARYLDLCFVGEHVHGDPHPADGENTETRWFRLDGPLPMNPRFQEQLEAALSGESAARFRQ